MKYLVAVDGSQHSRKALDLALSLAKGRENDEVVTLTVVDEYSAADLLDEEAILAAGTAPTSSLPPPPYVVSVPFFLTRGHVKARPSARPTWS